MLVRDATGSLRAVFFNQAFLNDVFHPHQRVILFGRLELTSHGLQMQNPQYEIIKAETESDSAPEMRRRPTPTMTRCTPGASSRSTRRPGQLTTKMQRAIVHQALSQLPETVPDPLPMDVRERQALVDRRTALVDVHFPPAGTAGRRR